MSIYTPLPDALLAERRWYGTDRMRVYSSVFTSPVTLSSISLSDRPVRCKQRKRIGVHVQHTF